MCLATPMRIVHIDGHNARCALHGIERTVSLFLLQDEQVTVGDHVLVHVGYAIERLEPEDARETLALLAGTP